MSEKIDLLFSIDGKLNQIKDNDHLSVKSLRDLDKSLKAVIQQHFSGIENQSTTQGQALWYQAETDSLGYQTGEFPRDMSFRDRDEE